MQGKIGSTERVQILFHHFFTNTDIADGSSFIQDGAVFKQVLRSA